jgi:hypothetical protein
LADTDSFPKQESIRRFRGIVVDSAVLEHDGGLRQLKDFFPSLASGILTRT